MNDTGSAELEWGIRQSFIAYVERLPDGVIQASDGAVRVGDVFLLPGRRLSPDAWEFEGVLHFSGYAGVLDVTLEAIRIDGDQLSAEVAGTRIPMALLAGQSALIDANTDAGVVRFDAVALTGDGAAVLGGVYPANAPADPVTIHPVSDLAGNPLSARVRTP